MSMKFRIDRGKVWFERSVNKLTMKKAFKNNVTIKLFDQVCNY